DRLPRDAASERWIKAVDLASDMEAWRDSAAETERIATPDAAVFVCVTLSDAELRWPLNSAIPSDRASFEAVTTHSAGLEPEFIGSLTALRRRSDAAITKTLTGTAASAGRSETPSGFLARAFPARVGAIDAGRFVYRLQPTAPAVRPRRQRSLVMLSGGYRHPILINGQYSACGSCSTCLLFANHTALDERVREVSL
ncbi:MAG: hypothetical protein AAFQ17_07615, partial [Pseudomonadota bacterium]